MIYQCFRVAFVADLIDEAVSYLLQQHAPRGRIILPPGPAMQFPHEWMPAVLPCVAVRMEQDVDDIYLILIEMYNC